MAKKTILLIEDNPKITASIREALGKSYHYETVRGAGAALAFLARKTPDLAIIDFDLKGEDGLQVFKRLGASAKVIMLSASGSIPLAVSAARLGVAEFLRKPIDAEQLRKAVEKNISRDEIRLRWRDGMEWLSGESLRLKEMLGEIKNVLKEDRDVILVGGKGSRKEKVAEFIHGNGPKKGRRMVKVDLALFREEALEAHFWATVQELVSIPEADSIQDEEERCGTIYLENIDDLDEHIQLTIFNFFRERGGKIDKSIRAIIGVCDRNRIQKLKIKDYAWIEVPKLRERKEDIPYLLALYLKRGSTKHGGNVKFISSELLDFLTAYDYPGDYLELERLIEEAALAAPGDKLELDKFPFDYRAFLQTSLKKSASKNLTLEEARRSFEKSLYFVLLRKAKGDASRVARFLDIPKTTLAERLEDLLD